MGPFSDFSFLSYIVVAIAYDFVLGKQTILLMEIALDRVINFSGRLPRDV